MNDWRVTQFDPSGNATTAEPYAGVVVWVHPENDLALIRINGESESFAIPVEDEPAVGTPFFYSGFGLAGAARGRLPVQESGGVLRVDPRLRDAGTVTMRATTDDPALRRVGVRAYRRQR